MADLKYFISESQRFRAGDGYVEDGMMAGGGWQRCSLCISARGSNNGPNVAHFRRQQNGIRVRLTGCTLCLQTVIKLSCTSSKTILKIVVANFSTFVQARHGQQAI